MRERVQDADLHLQGLLHRVQSGRELFAEPRGDDIDPRVLVKAGDRCQDLGGQRGRFVPRGLHWAVGVDVLEHRG
ncbi:hypothetical protein ABZT34_41070 [Streptomyces sp. NPDC005329]|uniref:hypothetical protein n=1 Tax=Streptomyces sp. NPDC005329 TaxID=3157034 RepID=UPI0033AC8871